MQRLDAYGAAPRPRRLPYARLRPVWADPAVRHAALATLALRLGLGLAGAVLVVVRQHTLAPGSLLLGPWQHDDALWFVAIATHGYGAPGTGAFLPALPALAAAAGRLVGGAAAGGLVVSTLATFVALLLVHRLTARELGPRAARCATLLLACAPTAFFLVAGYSDSLFLAEVAGVLLLARTGRLGWASLAGAAAIATRQQGLLLLPVLLSFAVLRWSAGNRRDAGALAHNLITACGAPLIALAALVIGYEVAGLGAGPWANEAGWGGHLALPWVTIGDSVRAVLGVGHPEEIVNLLAVLAVVAALPWIVKRLPLPYAVLTALSLLAMVCHENSYSPLMSSDRFLLAIPPVFMAGAAFVAQRHRLVWPVATVSAAVLTTEFVMFASNRFVG